ncbi:MAG: hypothetical protein J6S85_01745 [Methanobrevibacter sp.]|nr:hypothetical protein [Methanobrevibacter sp.]MBO7712258.1 hypothetical protein [Methanobrevibacter sp.]
MLITNFASGELSASLNGRIDLQQYFRGASKIENFDIIPTGGIKRRPGTQRIAELSGNNRIIPFIVNKNSIYILELKPYAIDVWKKGFSGYDIVQTIITEYSSLADIKELQYAQNYNSLVFVHKDYAPYELIVENGVFSGETMTFDFYPDVELDDDYNYIMITNGNLPEKDNTAEGSTRFTYYQMINNVNTEVVKEFKPGIKDFYCINKGKLYKWNVYEWTAYGQDPEIDISLFSQATKYPGCVSFFNNRLYFGCTGQKPQMVWASAAPDNYGTRYRDFATYKKFITVNKVTKEADLHIFTCDLDRTDIDTTNHITTFKNVTQNFTASGALVTDITDYFISSDIIPVGTKVLSATENTITVSTDNLALTWEEEETEKTNFVMSIQLWKTTDTVSAEDIEYMVVSNNSTTADCSFFFELASDQNDAIMFLSSNKFLAIGTESSIWSIDPGISALSINASMQGRYGSDNIQGQAIETATVYFAQGKKGIREFYWDGENNAFRTNNIALLADHILRESAVIDFDYMTNPYSRLIIVKADGSAALMLYDKTNGIMAWSRFTTEGKIKNCAVTRGEDENDYLFLVTEIDGHYYLEFFDYAGSVFLDSYAAYNGNITGYTDEAILYNETQEKKCSISDIPDDFIATGDIVYIGYLYSSYIKSMPVINNDTSGRRRITALQVRFLQSHLPVMKCTGLPEEKFTTVQNVPYSGVARVNYPGVTDHDVYFELEAKEPEEVNILSVDAITS